MPNALRRARVRTRIGLLKARILRRPPWPPRHTVRWGSFRRLQPISSVFGTDRGQPIDRYYIEQFFTRLSGDITGHVLEIGGSEYTEKFGQTGLQGEVLHAVEGNPKATIVGDLATGVGLKEAQFDCVILTQTLNVIYDLPSAVRTLHKILRPGGCVLATFPGICQISRYDMDRWGDYWRLTSLSALKLFREAFTEPHVEVSTYGNVMAAVAMLHGLSVGEISQAELDHHDRDYEVLVCVRARKSVD